MFGLIFIFSVFLHHCTGTVQIQEESCQNGFNGTGRRQNQSTCPAGFFCPDADLAPVPCPQGTFRSAEGSPLHQCVACPVNFFSAKLGQTACFPCGSEAVQPKEGQKSCICLREGRVFQPSDAHCPCAPGYESPTEDRRWACVRQVRDICRDAAVRNQEGACLTKEEWRQYCAGKVCALPKDYHGYDQVLGLCLCRGDTLDSVCNPQCRRRQRRALQFVCDQEQARLSMTYRNGSQENILLEETTASLQVLDLHTQNSCTSKENKESYPVYIVKTSGTGFLGVYDPEPELLHYFLTSNGNLASQNMLQTRVPSGTSSKEDSRLHRLPFQEPSNSTQRITFTGIFNPTTCLRIHDIILFMVSKDHYPVYDVNNLYNTNHEFDWGGFRRLVEETKLDSGFFNFSLFFYQFRDPGTYVLRLSSNQHKRMYVRVMPYGGQCYEEGPFFPTTPRHVVQVGIARIPDVVLKPDWQAMLGIIIGLFFLLIICLLLIMLCQTIGWSRKGSPQPYFRKLQLKYNLDKYSSRESKVITIKKYHPGIQKRGGLEKDPSHTEKKEGNCEIWDSDEHLDLDSFNANIFFEILLSQSMAVTAKLSQFKEELKLLYHKLLEETASLRDLWVARMCVPDRAEPCNDVLMGHYIKAKQQAEEEILRRKHLAAEYEESVSRQLRLLTQDLRHQEDQWVVFTSALREAMRLMEALEESLSPGEGSAIGSKLDHHRLLSLVDAASSQMSDAIIKESQRLMLWGVLGEGMGAHLVNKEKTRLLTKEELVGPDGSVKTHDVLHRDATTGLIMPNNDAVMLLANQSMKPVPMDHSLHPDTGKLLPVAGNVGFDAISSKLIPVVDLASGKIHHSEAPIFSYVPYPVCPGTGLPVKTNLPILQPEKLFKLGGLMQDPATGIEVPILGVTIHPQTGQKLSLGGTYLNPLTGTVTPLEIGGPMRAPEGGKIVPILGVTLDNNLGDVVPVGGLQGPSENLLLIGDSFIEPLSGKTARVQGICLQQDKMAPHAGGYQAALEANIPVTQIHVLKALREYKDSLCEDLCPAGDGLKALKAAEEDMITALSQKLNYLMFWLRNLEKQQERALSLKSTGGKLGMIKYPGTDLWIPAVFGLKILDPGGSGLMVPILGVECDWKTGQPIPLAGTIEDADGRGLVPLAVGFRTIDPITGETGPVIGAQISPWTNSVTPVVQIFGSLPRGNTDPDLLAALDKEITAKRAYWHSQREKEEELFKELEFLHFDILDAANEGKMKKLRYREKLKPTEEICHFLEESAAQETHRRTSRVLTMLGDLEQSLQTRADKDEKDQGGRFQLLLRKVLERLVQFIRKVQLEEGRLQIQMKEAERQWSKSLCPEEAIKEKSRKTMLHLVAEFQECMAKEQASVENAYCRLEYLRYLSDTLALQAKDLLSGLPQCFMNYPGDWFYGVAGGPWGSWEVIRRKLIPLLKSVVQALEDNRRVASSPEMLLGLQSGEGYSSRSTLKVSEVPSKALRTATSQDVAPTAPVPPTPSAQPTTNQSQLLQEVHNRIFLEKHASEMVHLELSLMAEEISMISCFCESSRLKKSLGMAHSQNLEVAREWETLLLELAEHHRHAEEDLGQQQREEIKCVGLNPDKVTLKGGALFSLEEILQNLTSLSTNLQKEDSDSRVAGEKSETQSLEGKFCASSIAQTMRATVIKMVKEEAAKQVWMYHVLDCYSHFQRRTCPEDVLWALDSLCSHVTGESVARDVGRSAEIQQVEKGVNFLQEHREAGDPLACFKGREETDLRKLQAQIQMKLQAQIEEALEAKEMEVMQEIAKQATRLPAVHMTYFLLTQRHLRQAVLVRTGGLALQRAGSVSPGGHSCTEDLLLDELLVDDDMKAIVQLMKAQKGCGHLLPELRQAAQMLRLREKQFQEMVRMLGPQSSDKCLEDASQIAIELQEYRQQKTKEMEEQLRNFLGSLKEPPNNSSPLQSESSLFEKEEKERKGKEKWKGLHEAQLAELEESYRGQILEEKAKLHDQLERGEIKKCSREKLMREHEETVTFLNKAFHQDIYKLKWRMEKEQKRKYSSQQDGNPSMSEATSSQNQPGQHQPGLAEEDRIRSFLAENIKILKQTELLVTLRIILLNPWLRPHLSDAKDADGMMSSQLLALLKEVNCQIQKCAAAVGLLDIHPPEEEAVNSFQDIMDIQLIPKSRQLEPLLASSLSAREFVIYQYGIIVLQFLRPHIGGPEIDLCIASSIPSSNASGNAFRNSFYYQNPGHKLFILRECLSCVGSFLLLLVHCLAHISADDLGQDSSPAFQRLFYQALKTCLSEMFSLRLQSSAVLESSKFAAKMINEAFLKREAITDEKINLLSGLFDGKVKPSTDTEKDLKQHLDVSLDAPLLKSNLSPEKKECSSCLIPDIHETVPTVSSPAASSPPTIPEAAVDNGGSSKDQLALRREKSVKLLEKDPTAFEGPACRDSRLRQDEVTNLEEDCLRREPGVMAGKGAKGKEA